MRVGFLVEQCLAPVPGGTGRYSRELAAALAPDGDVTGWTAYHRDVSAAVVPGVHGPRRLPLGRRALAVAWERGGGPGVPGADVVHAPTVLAPPRRRTPLVVTIHDAVPWTHPETLTPRGVAFHRRMGARIARTADLVLTVSEAVAAELAEILPLGDRLRVVPNGVTPALREPPPDAAERRRRLGVPEERLVTLATLEPRKGLDVAIEALAAVPGLPLVVAGQPGWGGVDVRSDRVIVLGRLDDLDLAAVLHGAVALVAPSRAEGFGLPVVEAMAAGVPVVVSDAPALVEVAGGAGVVTPVGDAAALGEALRTVASSPGLRDRLREAGLRRSEHYTWERAATLAWEAYRQVV